MVKKFKEDVKRRAVWIEPDAHAHAKELAARQRMQLNDYIAMLIDNTWRDAEKARTKEAQP